MVRNLNLKTHSKELEILSIALENKGFIREGDLERRNISSLLPIKLEELGYLKDEGEHKRPYVLYEITEKGKEYANKVKDILNNL